MNIVQSGLLGFYRACSTTEVLQTRWGRLLFETSYWFYKRYWETGSIDSLQRWVRPNSVVIDVGANIGYFTLQFASWLRDGGKVLALEPEALNYGRLQQAIKRAGCDALVEAIRVAAADITGEGMLEINPLHPGDHKLGTQGVPISMTTIDTLVAARGWPEVSLLKIDVQGAEARVLAGADETLRRFRPALFVEVDHEKLERYGSSDCAFLASITAREYTLHTLKRKAISGPLPVPQALAMAQAKGYVDLLCCP